MTEGVMHLVPQSVDSLGRRWGDKICPSAANLAINLHTMRRLVLKNLDTKREHTPAVEVLGWRRKIPESLLDMVASCNEMQNCEENSGVSHPRFI